MILAPSELLDEEGLRSGVVSPTSSFTLGRDEDETLGSHGTGDAHTLHANESMLHSGLAGHVPHDGLYYQWVKEMFPESEHDFWLNM